MSSFFNYALYQPIVSVLIFIYNTIAFGDLGVAIIFLTILVRIVLLPIFYKGAKDQALMQRLQPHIKQIQLDHKDNKEKQAQALLELYKKHKLNPFSSILLLIVQLPIFIVLFQIFTRELSTATFDNHLFLGLMNLEQKSVWIAIGTALLQYVQTKLTLPKSGGAAEKGASPLSSIGKTMGIIGPAITLVVLLNLPAALGVYWATSTVFSIVQQIYINKKLPKGED